MKSRIWILVALLFFCSSAHAATKKLLVLIIASDNHPAFLGLQEVWKSYMNLYPDEITAYFIKGDPLLEHDSELKGNTFYTKTVDNYKPGILKKTFLTLQALEKDLDEYEFVLRTNLSSIYDFPKLLQFLTTLPKERCYAARPLLPSYEVPSEYSQIPFGWGAGFIISPDVARLILSEKEKIFAKIDTIPDDVLIGAILYEHKVPLLPVPFMTFTKREEWESHKKSLPQNVFHFRAKSHYLTRRLDDDYEDELYIASDIAKTLYPNIQLKNSFPSSYPLEIALETVYEYHAAYPSDTNEYMPYVQTLAKECASCCEVGESDLVWTWAIAQGLAKSQKEGRKYIGIFNKKPPALNLLLAHKLAQENGIDFSLKSAPETCDLLVANSFPSTGATIQKYIVVYGKSDLWPDARRFLLDHPEWKLKIRYEKCIILERG